MQITYAVSVIGNQLIGIDICKSGSSTRLQNNPKTALQKDW